MDCSLRIQTNSPEETQRLGEVIGRSAQPGDIYLLTGILGAGKTCLTQGIAQGLGVGGHVRSPTFVLMTRYRGRLTLHHVDLYRIEGSLEAWDLGLEEQLGDDGVCVVEWADRAEELFSQECLWIAMDHVYDGDRREEGQRSLTFQDYSQDGEGRYREMLRRLGVRAQDAAYVGDRQFEDVQGATGVGINAIWINRSKAALDPKLLKPAGQISSLLELPSLLSGMKPTNP